MRDVLQNLKVEDVERSFRARFLQILKMEDFRARRPSKSESGRCENEAFVRDVLLILKGQLVKIKPELSVPLRGRSEHDPTLQKKCSATVRRTSFRIHLPGNVLPCKTQHFVHLLRLSVKNSFRARLPSKSEHGRCENEAFVRDFP